MPDSLHSGLELHDAGLLELQGAEQLPRLRRYRALPGCQLLIPLRRLVVELLDLSRELPVLELLPLELGPLLLLLDLGFRRGIMPLVVEVVMAPVVWWSLSSCYQGRTALYDIVQGYRGC